MWKRDHRLPRHALATLAALAAFMTFGACHRAPPAANPRATPPALARRSATTPPAASPAPARARGRHRSPASGRTRRYLHLIRTSGRANGPIPYITVEPVIGSGHRAPPTTPIIIALHGRGDTTRAFARLIEALDLPVRAIVAQGPIRWGPNNGTEWFDGTGPKGKAQILRRMRDLRILAGQLAKTYPGAPKPILLGFSQGAILTLEAIAREPELFSAGVALSGFLPITTGDVKTRRPVPLLLTLGTHDTLVPPAKTDAAATALRALGHHPIIFRFPRGHAVTHAVRQRVRAFLQTQLARLRTPR